MEQDASPVVSEGAEAPCRVLESLDDAVVDLGRGIRDGVEEVGQEVGQMTPEHPRHLDHRRQSESHGLGVPSHEQTVGARRVDMPPEPLEQIDDPLGSRRLQTVLLNRVEALTLLGIEVCLVEEPELSGALELVIVLRLKGVVFGPSHLIDYLPEMLCDVELVVNQFGVRSLSSDGLGIGWEHVAADSTHPPVVARR